jgi:plastocyanin
MKIKMKQKILSILVIVLIISSCKKDDTTSGSGSPGANEVWIQNMAFNPSTITVAANTTIKWTNKDSNTHTATSNTSVFNSGNLSKDGTFSFNFTTAGTFAYHCAIHSSMTATVIVH